MKISIVFILCLFFFSVANGQNFNQSLRDELLKMREVDQEAREDCAKGDADAQVKCLVKISETTDKPNTKRLEEIFARYGFPTEKTVGKEGVQAFMLLLQHAPDDNLREKALKPIKRAFQRKEISPAEYANFVDRLLIHKGEEQIYGSNFETKDGKLVMSKTKDLKNLDKRRKKIGLPPIAEYAKMLKDFYKLEVEIPDFSKENQ
jgi:hypothetical protein